jgi:hypothetical protein
MPAITAAATVLFILLMRFLLLLFSRGVVPITMQQHVELSNCHYGDSSLITQKKQGAVPVILRYQSPRIR